ncbi:histidine phosphatase family protein [Ktedonosporobacter rubrisoli]|uniref:Histidine phosphatase family protein n=1 Tax=Ktedonosporobacter rubrisoli TaxID=2509675 RepID=A0A4P6K4L0_KTERU|nr:histidine phosphatase family protein [Ktedonosporobacter rubrisoli]QBD82466.1 histidine phosphatase family protein [Ktedonosporobacter rubrisoli]
MQKILYIIRHCQAEGQQPDAPLTATGRTQAAALARFLAQTSIERIVSSPFTRAIQSVEPLARELRLEIETDDRLIERVLSITPLADWLGALRATFSDLDLRFVGGESSREATARAVAAVTDILQQPCQVSVLVSHGNLSTLLLKHFDQNIGFETWYHMTNPDVFRITLAESGPKVERLWQTDV